MGKTLAKYRNHTKHKKNNNKKKQNQKATQSQHTFAERTSSQTNDFQTALCALYTRMSAATGVTDVYNLWLVGWWVMRSDDGNALRRALVSLTFRRYCARNCQIGKDHTHVNKRSYLHMYEKLHLCAKNFDIKDCAVCHNTFFLQNS